MCKYADMQIGGCVNANNNFLGRAAVILLFFCCVAHLYFGNQSSFYRSEWTTLCRIKLQNVQVSDPEINSARLHRRCHKINCRPKKILYSIIKHIV